MWVIKIIFLATTTSGFSVAEATTSLLSTPAPAASANTTPMSLRKRKIIKVVTPKIVRTPKGLKVKKTAQKLAFEEDSDCKFLKKLSEI